MNDAMSPPPAELMALLTLYGLMLLVNILISGLLWRRTKEPLYRLLLVTWLAVVVNLLLTGATANQPSIVRMQLFALTFAFNWPMGSLLARIAGFDIPVRRVVAALLGAVGLTLALYLSGAPQAAYVLPISLAAPLPTYYASLGALARRSRITFSAAGFAVVLLLYSLHMSDYGYLHDVPSFAPIGFTIAIVLIFAVSVFAPAAITESISQENERLKLLLDYESKAVTTAKMAAIGELAGGMAHEVNNPLVIARVNLSQIRELIAEREKDPAAFDRPVNDAEKALDRIARIVSGLRIFAGHEIPGAGKAQRLSGLMESVLAISQERAQAAGVRLEEANAAPEAAIRCAASEFMQVLVNLIANACEAAGALAPERRWVRLGYERSPSAVAIRVTDGGSGIAPEVAAKMMQPFFTTKPPGKGTGMGLSVASGILKKAGGGLRYELHGGNTSFVATVPLG